MCQFDVPKDKNLLVGLDTNDDAAVYKINNDIAVIETVDYFTPIVDDPYDYGQIAAANALSDVYAMGGKPIFALNVVCFPTQYIDLLKEILKGGNDKVKEAGAYIAGGHTIEDSEPKYGLNVTGVVSPDSVIKNSNSKVGDVLILTKPIGSGIVSTALKGEMCPKDVEDKTISVMKYLNKNAANAMIEVGVNACTDVTGFSLIGHAFEMAHFSGVTIEISSKDVPIIEGVKELSSKGLIPGGTYRNKQYLKKYVKFENPDNTMEDILYDPQTSGGLLISVSESKAVSLVNKINSMSNISCHIVGRVLKKEDYDIIVK